LWLRFASFIRKLLLPRYVKIGNNVIIHRKCTIGTQGFGFVMNKDGTWIHIPHIGGIIIGDNVEIFPGTNIDRGTVNNTIIGDGVKIDHMCTLATIQRLVKIVLLQPMSLCVVVQ